MFKALKWAYDLGIRHERIRISAHLQNISRQADYFEERSFAALHDDKTSKRVKSRLDFELAVESKIKATVESIMKPQTSDYWGYSIMFPDDEHNREVK